MYVGVPPNGRRRSGIEGPALALLALRFDCAALPVRVERLDSAHFG